ncbi:unnamed protein product [Amoebophrya sp. A25]|nr:unnamed protein product [Amoebophrya sp. A25]|eukprot:GSA25T00023368001.1
MPGDEKVVKNCQQGDAGHQEIEAMDAHESSQQGDVGQGHKNPNDFHVRREVRDHFDNGGSKTGNTSASSSTSSPVGTVFSGENSEKNNKGRGTPTNTSSTSTSLSVSSGSPAISRRPLREVHQHADVETIRSLFGLKALRMLRERWWLPLRTFLSQLESPKNSTTSKFTNATPSNATTSSTSYAVHASRWFGQVIGDKRGRCELMSAPAPGV